MWGFGSVLYLELQGHYIEVSRNSTRLCGIREKKQVWVQQKMLKILEARDIVLEQKFRWQVNCGLVHSSREETILRNSQKIIKMPVLLMGIMSNGGCQGPPSGSYSDQLSTVLWCVEWRELL